MLLDVLKEKGTTGRITVTLPYGVDELTLCYDGSVVHVRALEELPPDFAVKRFVERWVLSGTRPVFELYEADDCSEDYGGTLSEEELLGIVGDPHLKSIKKLPESFIIKFMDASKFPPALVSYWTAKKPVMKVDLHRLGISIADFLKLMEEGAIEIEPYDYQEAIPLKARILVILLLVLSLLYLFLPVNLLRFTDIKLLEALNWAMKEKVLDEEVDRRELPVTDCLGKNVWLIEDAVVSPGLDGQLGTEDDKKKSLPKSGYKPFFALPVR
ncbi:hypothetical protein [Phorcysia thermohydrogeniphila]|nr:hypothetical protein [Phorcysia thermohydrogeniphila]